MAVLEQMFGNKYVVLPCDSSVSNAARAMVNHSTGCVVVVNEHGEPCGMVTDRDLLFGYAGEEINAETEIGRVMTKPLICLDSSEGIMQAVLRMAEYGIRHLPLTRTYPNGKKQIIGVLTLDDVIMHQMAELDELSTIIKAQVGHQKRRKKRFNLRTIARRRQKYHAFIKNFADRCGFDFGIAESVVFCVLGFICRRLTPEEAHHLIAQLPSDMKDPLRSISKGPDKSIHPGGIVREVALLLQIEERLAREVVILCWRYLKSQISRGEVLDMLSQLPDEFEDVFVAS